ncbi:NAD(P)/FAD-dependent oxidoreductase [Flavimarina sp. Hel_I_48]|uniref:NAD(P)/FAD-dependent oxidoreductase n=1 Tax=Flavimarina sp. Hel_I_48 TaxID=1392488 RepID=UPI0004DEE149|nr:NAD(P)/FAD-dependent oxidoreductase [Flavimarina sp. Hel_I_48]
MEGNEKSTVHIIGAGISGLIAALVLEEQGYAPVIYESTSQEGGRLKTEMHNNYQLDHGFQILLGAYPKAKQYLEYDALDLQEILPGAVVFFSDKKSTIGDPLRQLSFLVPTLTSSLANLRDKAKMIQLYMKLKNTSLNAIFEEKEQTSLEFLKDFGFSERVIHRFFRPFFSGIFLEPNLATSSRMFQFVFKLFGEGSAYIPKRGISAIPKQLKAKLKKTKFHFNTPVERVEEGTIFLENGTVIPSENTIIATTASNLVTNLKNQEIPWKSCINLYFEVDKRKIQKAIIGLVADTESLINNIFYHTSVKTEAQGARELLSVTVVKPTNLTEKQLVERILADLEKYCKITGATFLKQFTIKKALPDISQLQYEMSPTETQLTNGIFLAGDQLLNPSLNAAMIAGERAAMAVLKKIQGGTILG